MSDRKLESFLSIQKVFALTLVCYLAFLLGVLLCPASAEELEAVREATRVLEEEVRLSTRPQLYLLLKLEDRKLILKGRGVELRQLPIEEWSVSNEHELGRVFALRSRPPVPRPKTKPGKDPTLEPIEVQHMPPSFELIFDPNLAILVGPSWREQPWLWVRTTVEDWYQRVRHPETIHLRLVVAPETAQFLAWSVLEGMPLLIKRHSKSEG